MTVNNRLTWPSVILVDEVLDFPLVGEDEVLDISLVGKDEVLDFSLVGEDEVLEFSLVDEDEVSCFSLIGLSPAGELTPGIVLTLLMSALFQSGTKQMSILLFSEGSSPEIDSS